MPMTLTPVEIETGSQDREGLLVFDGARLLSILVRLSEIHEERSGGWYLEYGLASKPRGLAFDDLDDALAWIENDDQARHSTP